MMRFTKAKKLAIKNEVLCHLFILPVILGILLFTLTPMITSLYYSFFEYYSYDAAPTAFIGFRNFTDMFTVYAGETFSSLGVTFEYLLISLPVNLVLSFALAMFLNKNRPGIKFFRTIYYLPVIIPAVVGGLLWSDIAKQDDGVLNYILNGLGLPSYPFYSDASTVMPTLIFMSLFNLGGSMVLWIAQLKTIPEELYEVGKLEGAGFFTRTFKITVPMCTPMIFYNLVMGVINGLQTFASVYLLRTPLNQDAMNFFVVHIYEKAFGTFTMGYACALSWLLFAIIAVLSAVMFKLSKWVYYGESA